MIISLIAAMSKNRVIGVGNNLPWHIPEDLARFKKITLGHPVIMGRKTFDSIGRPLPKRPNIVVTRNLEFSVPGSRVVASVSEALDPYRKTSEEVFILGGGEIFLHSWPLANKIYLTLIDQVFSGDVYFPEIDYSLFKVTFEEHHDGPPPFTFIDYERISLK